jgi:hypothetical protein
MVRKLLGTGLLAAVLLLPLLAVPQTTAPGKEKDTAPALPSGMAPTEAVPFAEPVLGNNAITLGWKPSYAFPAASQAAPSLRLGVVTASRTSRRGCILPSRAPSWSRGDGGSPQVPR